MNKYQRIVLCIGAVCLIIVILTTPRVQYTPYGGVFKADTSEKAANVLDIRTALVRCFGVVGATMFVWFSLSKLKPRDNDKTGK